MIYDLVRYIMDDETSLHHPKKVKKYMVSEALYYISGCKCNVEHYPKKVKKYMVPKALYYISICKCRRLWLYHWVRAHIVTIKIIS